VSFDTLAAELQLRFSRGVGVPWTEEEFNWFALLSFGEQFRTNPTYRAFCEGRGRTPGTVTTWEDVPAVPTAAFKHLDLIAPDAEKPQAVFLTSGTSGGSTRRGRHLVRSLDLYRSSLLPTFQAHVLSDVDRIAFASLVPSPTELPDSSLSFMVAAAAEAFASEVRWLVDSAGKLDLDGLRTLASHSSNTGKPVLLLGTAFAFVHMLERIDEDLTPLAPFATGSRIMETGGFKGRVREIPRPELYAQIAAATGVPAARVVNEYGMTELLSQLYEAVLSEGPGAVGTHLPPPWLRVRALDPATLQSLPSGEDGILAFFDLANLGSVCHVLTEDVGSVIDGRVRLSGRMEGADLRGCSRAMDEMIAAAAPTS
jgi:hypothetical protein